MIEQKYKNIVWDWNGTLLDDVDTGVRTLADMLARRGLCPLSLEEYKAQFGFPVEEFYHKVGFDMEKESMHELSVDFVETYDKFAGHLALNPEVREHFTVGIMGMGVMGTAIARSLMPFRFPLRGWSRTRKEMDGVTCYYGNDQLTDQKE